MLDLDGKWPKWIKKTAKWIDDSIIQPVNGFANDIEEDFKNYDRNNQSEEKVFESNYFSCYKGGVVVKLPFDTSFSFGIIGLSTQQQDLDTLKHEYGHSVQMDNMGVVKYITNVAIPSVTINILDRQGKLPYDYYSYPWEAEANKLGGTALTDSNPPLPKGGYTSYWSLVLLFFK